MKSIVGEEWASEEDWKTFTYRRGLTDLGSQRPWPPMYLVHPKNTNEVREILIFANERRMPVFVSSIGCGMDAAKGWGQVRAPGALLLDMRRMKKIEVDAKHMVAIVEPGVMSGELYRETRKFGLSFSSPSVAYTHGIAGNYCMGGAGGPTCPFGRHNDLVTGVELVLPTGEVIRTGTASLGVGWWKEDPWLTRLICQSAAWFGVVTKLAVKLWPIPKEDEYSYVFVGCDTIECMQKVLYGVQWNWLTNQHAIVRGLCNDWMSWVTTSMEMMKDCFGEEDEWPETVTELRQMGYDMLKEPAYGGLSTFTFMFGIVGPEKARKCAEEVIEGIVKEAPGSKVIPEEDLHPDIPEFKVETVFNRPRYRSHLRAVFAKGMRATAGFQCPWDKFVDLTKKGYEILEQMDYVATGSTATGAGNHQHTGYHWYAPFGNPDTPEKIAKCREFRRRLTAASLANGGYVAGGGITDSPEQSLLHRMGLYADVLKRVKKAFDPNEIMSPRVF